MAFERVFLDAATFLDTSLIEIMDNSIGGTIAAVRAQLVTAMSLYVLGMGALMMFGRVSLGEFQAAAVRSVVISSILISANYNSYVRDFFFTDAPNAIAASVGGQKMGRGDSDLFDTLWRGIFNYAMYIFSRLGPSIWGAAFAAITLIIAMIMFGLLWVMFLLWYIPRIFMAVALVMGPWLIPLFLWQSTRGFTQQWIGKLVGLLVQGLSSAVLLRMMFLLNADIMSKLPYHEDNYLLCIGSLLTMLGVIGLSAVLMFVLPGAMAIGSGVGSSAAVTFAMSAGVIGQAAGLAGAVAQLGAKAAGNMARSLNQITGAASRGAGTGSSSFRNRP